MNRHLLPALFIAILAAPAWAAVTFVGVESGAPPNFQAQRWSLATEKKTHAVTNQLYGCSGYYCLAPGADVPSKPVAESAIAGFGTAFCKPDFLAAYPTVVAGTWVNYPGYAMVTKPEAAGAGDAFRIGGISATVAAPTKGAGAETKYVEVFSFKLTAGVRFRFGIMVDAFDGGGAYAPDYVSVSEDVSQKAVYNTAPLKRDGLPDLVLFDIEGKAGTTCTVALHRRTPTDGATVGFSLITFDRLSGADFKPAISKVSAHIGQFERAGEYMKDYYVFKEGNTFHLFYNVGVAGPTQDWQAPGNEKAFGHATSKDLVNWQHHPRVLPVVPGTWEGQVVSAPSILKHGGKFYMVYSGFDDRVVGKQSIGLATSANLFDWERHPANPVYTATLWTIVHPNGWIDCRDAHIVRYRDEFLLFTMVTTKEGKGAISLASSLDAVKWQDLGPAVITFSQPESPRVFEHQGTYYLFASSANGRKLLKTKNPKSNDWEPVPFEWPAPGLWSGWEVVEHNGRLVFSAFEWKTNGNYIRFWDVKWDGDVPTVIYNK
jgi:hypothetical protein